MTLNSANIIDINDRTVCINLGSDSVVTITCNNVIINSLSLQWVTLMLSVVWCITPDRTRTILRRVHSRTNMQMLYRLLFPWTLLKWLHSCMVFSHSTIWRVIKCKYMRADNTVPSFSFDRVCVFSYYMCVLDWCVLMCVCYLRLKKHYYT